MKQQKYAQEIKYYTLYVCEAKHKLPYCLVIKKAIKFKHKKNFDKLLKFYKQKFDSSKDEARDKYRYVSNAKTKTVYRIILKEYYSFETKKNYIEQVLKSEHQEMCLEEYFNEGKNWGKANNKKILNCMGNYLLLGEDEEDKTLTSRQIRYIKEKEITVDFSIFETKENITENIDIKGKSLKDYNNNDYGSENYSI